MSEVLRLCSPDNKGVAIKRDQIIGFNYKDNGYIVYLNGGGSVKVRSGFYEYSVLTDAMEENEVEGSKTEYE